MQFNLVSVGLLNSLWFIHFCVSLTFKNIQLGEKLMFKTLQYYMVCREKESKGIAC